VLAVLLVLFGLGSAQACDNVTYYTYNAYGQLVPVHVPHQPVVHAPLVHRPARVNRTVVVQPVAPVQPLLTFAIATPTWSFTYAAPTPPPRTVRTTTVRTTRVTRRR
jgi:hypothetical protein